MFGYNKEEMKNQLDMSSRSSLRVCIICEKFPPAYSGAGVAACRLGTLLSRFGVDVKVLSARLPGVPRFERMGDMEVRRSFARRSTRRSGDLIYSALLTWELIVMRRRYDVAHFFGMGDTYYLPILMIKAIGKRIIVRASSLGSDDLSSIRSYRFGWLRLRVLELIDAFIGNSPIVTKASLQVSQNVGVVEISSGADLEVFRPVNSEEERLSLRRELGMSKKDYVAIFIGFVCENKGAYFLAEVWSSLMFNVPDAQLYLIGPRRLSSRIGGKDFISRLDQYIVGHSLDNNIHFREVKDVVPYLKAADVFVNASLREGLPNAMIEAIACGLPVIVRDKPWVCAELVEDGINGYVVADENPASYAERLNELYQKPRLRVALGRESRNKALFYFSLEEKARAHVDLYRKVIYK